MSGQGSPSGCGFTTRRVCVFVPARIARTLSVSNMIGLDFTMPPEAASRDRTERGRVVGPVRPRRPDTRSTSLSRTPGTGLAAGRRDGRRCCRMCTADRHASSSGSSRPHACSRRSSAARRGAVTASTTVSQPRKQAIRVPFAAGPHRLGAAGDVIGPRTRRTVCLRPAGHFCSSGAA